MVLCRNSSHKLIALIVLSDSRVKIEKKARIWICNRVKIPIYLTQTPQVRKIDAKQFHLNQLKELINFFCATMNEYRPKKEKNIKIVSNKMNLDCVSREFSRMNSNEEKKAI